MLRTRVKICCIASIEEARTAIACGADAIGLVGKMPSGPGVIDDKTIAEIAAAVPPPVATFLLTSETTASGVISHWKRTMTSAIQLVDYVGEAEYGKIRSELPQVKLVQVVHVEDGGAVTRARELSKFVDALLLDSGRPGADVKILGGTGNKHDWGISREIVRSVNIPVFLAGGITPENVRSAIETVRPYGIDLCTGVRKEGLLDRGRVERLMNEVLKASIA